MSESAIIVPAIALAWWTLIVLLLIPQRRFKAIREHKLRPDDFSLGESANVHAQESVALANRNYMNLLELPVIFYVVCCVNYMMGLSTSAIVGLAWLYVVLRVAHSLVHVTYNDIRQRFILFGISNLVLLVMLLLTTLAIL